MRSCSVTSRSVTPAVFRVARRLPALRGLASALACLMALPLCLPFAPSARADTPPAHSALATVLQLQQMEKQAKAHPAPPVPSPANRLANTPYAAPRVSAPASLPASAAPVLLNTAPPRPASVTLLDEVGRLARAVAPAEAAGWKRELHTQSPAPTRAALLHLWLGEWELAANQQPRAARAQFAQAQRLTTAKDDVYWLAAYDTATALFYEGAYRDAQDAFHRLLVLQTCLPGYSRRTCARWYRHAAACAGSHADHEKLGIPEPPRLDPDCGAAALAACLRGLAVPSDRKTVLAACRVTGEGSSLQDVLEAAQKLGLTGRAITADDTGLMALPKPLVAYVEQDHFVALVRADKAGVSYLCSDCGPWPGGRVNLTWAQWHSLSPGLYGSVMKPGSAWDKKLASVLAPLPATASSVRLASARPLVGLGVAQVSALLPSLSLLRGHVLRYQGLTAPVSCGYKPTAQQCPSYITCPMSCPTNLGHAMNQGPSDGDPVNLATGEEEYHPAADLTVYNPVGPSVVWSRVYNSLRDNSQDYYPTGSFGSGWNNPYDVYVRASPSNHTSCNLVMPNGSSIHFYTPYYSSDADCLFAVRTSAPFSSKCSVDTGGGVGVTATFRHFDSQGLTDYGTMLTGFKVTFPDRTSWLFEPNKRTTGVGNVYNSSQVSGVYTMGLTAIVDRNGHSLRFSQTSTGYAINNDAGTALLSVSYSNSTISTITDCYHRRVCYHVGTYNTTNVPTNYPQSYLELDHVSQVVPDSLTSGPDRYAYGYVGVNNGDGGTGGGGETISFLHSITVPAPSSANPASGSLSAGMAGTSSSYINYSPNTCYVSSLVDSNGNTRTYTVVDGTHTKVTVTNAQNQTVFSSTSGFDSHMSKQTETDGANTPVYQVLQWSTNDPYRPAQTQDGNGNVSSYTWDQYGNMLTMTPPSNGTRTPAKTTYTYKFPDADHPNVFPLGELAQVQQGSKAPTSYTYYEPSGLAASVQGPLPGSPGTVNPTPTTYTYDLTTYDSNGNVTHQGLGNLLTVTTPGNNAASAITTTFGYTTDNGYTQTAAIGQPLTVADNLGKVTHLRYDSRGNCLSVADAISSWFPDQYDFTYNIADQPLQTLCPAANQQGSGRTTLTSAYLYPGGPLTGVTTTDETGAAIRQVSYAYGQEGETLGVSGSAEPATYTYDALYRLSALTDGNGHATRYYYKQQGYLDAVTYPGYVGPAPVYNATVDDYDNISGKDSVRYPAYDANGNLLRRIDGNNFTTTYTYNDPQSLLTNIHYVYPSYMGGKTGDVSLAYDAYGRRAGMTDGTGRQSFAYDDGDAPLSVTTTYTGLSAYMVSYSYWPNGSRQSMTSPVGSYNYTYDAVGRLTGMTNPYGQTAAWSYLDNGWADHRTLSNAGTPVTVTSHYYDQRGELTGLRNRSVSNATLSDYAGPVSGMVYDGAGNRTAWVSTVPAMPQYSRTTGYTYDGKNQLTQEASTAFNYTNGFGYDSAGNITSFKGQGHAYNADNQDVANTYDGNGNPIVCSGQSVTFDPENRMTRWGNVLACGYNGDGQRAWKQNSAGARTYFLYDGSQPVCEMDGSGAVVAFNDFGADGVWARHTQVTDWFYTFDPQGCLSQKIGRDGSVLCSSIYDAQGHEATTDTHPDPFSGYGGQWGYYGDWETSGDNGGSCLYLLGHRFYDPNAGRFINRDPIGYRGGVNVYAYTGNDPVNRADPSGLTVFGIGGSAGAGAGVFGAGGGAAGSVTISVDTDGNVGVVITGTGYGAGAGALAGVGSTATGGGGAGYEFGGVGTVSTGVLTNGTVETGTVGGQGGSVVGGGASVNTPLPGMSGPTTVAVSVGEGGGAFVGAGVSTTTTYIIGHLPDPFSNFNGNPPPPCDQPRQPPRGTVGYTP